MSLWSTVEIEGVAHPRVSIRTFIDNWFGMCYEYTKHIEYDGDRFAIEIRVCLDGRHAFETLNRFVADLKREAATVYVTTYSISE